MSLDEILGTAEAVVAKARRLGAESAEAFLLRGGAGSARIEKNQITGVETESQSGIGIRVLKDKRVGFAYVQGLAQTPDGIKAALKACRLSKPLPKFAFASRQKVPRVAGVYDAKVAALEGPDLIEAALQMQRAVHDADPKLDVTEAGASSSTTHTAIATSEGVALSHQETSYGASCFVVQNQVGVSTGFASQESTRRDVDGARLGKEAARLALAARRPKKLDKAGAYPILLRPDPAADLLETITVPSLYGKAAHRDESFYSGKLGRAVAHAKLSLVDDPTRPRGLGSAPFDDEGEASRPLAAIRRGTLKAFLYDRSSGAEYRAASTGSAVRSHPFDGRSYKSPPGASGRNMLVEAPSRATAKLVAGIDDGLLVHDLMGVHTANTVSGDFSVTSSLLFRIRKGSVEEAVAPVSIAGNFHATLKAGLVLGDDLKQTSGGACISIPSVRIDSFTVTP